MKLKRTECFQLLRCLQTLIGFNSLGLFPPKNQKKPCFETLELEGKPQKASLLKTSRMVSNNGRNKPATLWKGGGDTLKERISLLHCTICKDKVHFFIILSHLTFNVYMFFSKFVLQYFCTDTIFLVLLGKILKLLFFLTEPS